jgi:putative aldouronate transport system substrate-binding protein
MFRRRIFKLLSIVVLAAILAAACAPQANAPGAAEEAASEAVAVSPAGEFPIVSEEITLSVFLCPTSLIRDYKDNEFTRWVEEKTNINL